MNALFRCMKLVAAAVIILPLLTGCWDRQEIDERAVVLGIGIDEATPEEGKQEEEISHIKGKLPAPEQGLIRLTAQIAVPGRIPLGPGEGGGGGDAQETVWVLNVAGHTINDAINNLQQKVASPLFFGHLRVIVVSESLAKKGIDNINEYFRRNPDVRRMNWMFVCKGNAADYLKTSPELERVPTLYLLTTMDQSVKMGRYPNAFLGVFWSAQSAKGQDGYLPYIELKNKESILLSGLAYFKGNKLVGTTVPLEITIYMGIMGLNPASGQAFIRVPGTDHYVMFGARFRSSHVRLRMAEGKPLMQIKINIEGNLLEKTSDQFSLDPELIEQIERQLEADAKKGYEGLIKETQKKGSDIFGFGEHIRAKKPSYWNREIRTKDKWQQAYQDLPVELQVKVNIRRVGMKSR